MERQYRPNAGIVLFNRAGKVFMGARKDKAGMQWQFPQGGIEPGETPAQAACRELCEETGIRNIRLLHTLNQPVCYPYPAGIVRRHKEIGRPDCGAEQYWSLVYFTGCDEEIDFATHPEEIEFKAYRWVDLEEAPERVVSWKKESYLIAARAFRPLIDRYLQNMDDKAGCQY